MVDRSDTTRDITTAYDHPQETNLLNLHKAMEYNAAGAPVLRVNNAGSDVYATIDWEEVSR